MKRLEAILKDMVEKKASDLILKVGSPVCMRINGELFKDSAELLTEGDLNRLVSEAMDEGQRREAFKTQKELVLSFGVKDLGRFRATLFQQRGTLVIVMRAR